MKYFNCKIKKYDDKHFSITKYSYPVRYDFEKNNIDDSDYSFIPSLNDKISNIKHSIISSRNRAKNKIYDYARSNKFDYFFTMTFNPDKVDSFNYDDVSRVLSNWLHNVKKRKCPDMSYLFVPELHKSGRYHFHGLVSNCDGLNLVDSGLTDKTGHIIFNINDFNFGFTTATKIINPEKTASYIGKYITKELSGHLAGKKHYWASRNLNLPVVQKISMQDLAYIENFDINDLEKNCVYKKVIDFEIEGVQRKIEIFEFVKK